MVTWIGSAPSLENFSLLVRPIRFLLLCIGPLLITTGVIRELEFTKDYRLSQPASLAVLTMSSTIHKQDLLDMKAVSYSSIRTHVGRGGE